MTPLQTQFKAMLQRSAYDILERFDFYKTADTLITLKHDWVGHLIQDARQEHFAQHSRVADVLVLPPPPPFTVSAELRERIVNRLQNSAQSACIEAIHYAVAQVNEIWWGGTHCAGDVFSVVVRPDGLLKLYFSLASCNNLHTDVIVRERINFTANREAYIRERLGAQSKPCSATQPFVCKRESRKLLLD